MNDNYQKLFRTYDEMDSIYQKLHASSKVNEPYLVKLHNDNRILTFFGSRHSNDIHDLQNQTIEKEWQIFVNNTNGQKVAFCEGGLRPLEKDKNTSILKYSEPGLLTWLAHKDSVPILSPEPDETKEATYLLKKFTVADIMTYYFARQMYQWLKRDYKNNPDWKAYATHYIKSYASLKTLKNEKLNLANVLSMYKTVTGVSFEKDDEKRLYSLSDPTSNPVSAESGVYRDISLFNAISEAWNSSKDVFALYGSGHAIVLEKALTSLS